MRISEKFGLLVDLVAQALADAIPFTSFYIMWLLLFSTLFKIQSMEVDTEDYSSLGEKMIYLTKTYRDSVGDIAAPIYPTWES